MTDITTAPNPTVEDNTGGEPGSLKARIEARRRELEGQQDASIVLPGPPGLEDLVAIQYRPLGFREMWKIESRHEKNPDGAEQALLTAVDKMIAACEQILEVRGEDYVPTGHVWNAAAAREVFGLDLPDGTTARQAVFAAFRGDKGEEDIARHVGTYEEQRQIVRGSVDRRVEGESAGTSAQS